ncbi:MAG TPA: maleylpyruvate isomerase N-terminal domain-containing protein [Acidimicrobiales bacterium]|jgi:uncharacterized protein (TIGR03083 family)
MSIDLAQTPATGQESLAHLERETLRFVEVAERSPLAAHVPAYPAFTVETLSVHIGRALRIFGAVVAGASEPEGAGGDAPSGPAVVGWVKEGLSPLLGVLREVRPDTLVPFPHGVGNRPASLVAPSLAVEVGVHRWDLESVLGDHAPIPSDLAIEEIDRVFESFVPRLAGADVAPIGGTVELRATDVAVSWAISVHDGHLDAARRTSRTVEPDVVVAASAEDLALVVWKRSPPPRPGVEVTGRVDVLKRFLAVDYIPDPRTTPAH